MEPQNELRHRPRSVLIHEDLQPPTRIDIPEETTREHPPPPVQAGNTEENIAYPDHAKRLTTYAKTATLITIGLINAFYTSKLDTEENKLFIVASFTSLIFALLFEIVLFMLIGCVERPDPDPQCLRCRYEEKLYISIYGSNLLLMLTAFFLLLLCTFRYAYLAVFLLLALWVICILLKQGSKLKHTESIKKYRELHDSELNLFSELSAAVVIMLFAGLSSIVFSSPNLSRNNDQMKVTECFLFVILVMSLLLMLLTSVPPAVTEVDSDTIVRMVGIIKSLSYTLISVLTLVGLMAAGEVLQGLVVFSTFAHIIGATYWLVKEVQYEPNRADTDPIQDQGQADTNRNQDQGRADTNPNQDQGRADTNPNQDQGRADTDLNQDQGRADTDPIQDQSRADTNPIQDQSRADNIPNQDQGRAKMELDSLSMVFASGAFSVLMYVYSKNVDNSEPYSLWNYSLLAVCMISLCSTFISCLGKTVIFSHALQTRAWQKAETILYYITYISLFVAVLSTTVLAVYCGLTSKKSSN